MNRVIHINPLRWFTDGEGGVEFVESFGHPVTADLVEEARAFSYPAVRDVLASLRAEGLWARCLFGLDPRGEGREPGGEEEPLPGPALLTDADRLGGLALAVVGDRGRVPADAPVAGLTLRGPGEGAAERAAAVLAESFGPQVMWADDLSRVILVQPGMAPTTVAAGWRRAVARA